MTDLQEYRKKLKEHHICRDCKKQDAYTLNGRTYCADCAEKRAKSHREQRAKDGGEKDRQYCKKRKDYTKALNSVYGMELQADNVEACINNIIDLCNEYFTPTKAEIQIINDHIIQADSLKVLKMINERSDKK